ncbi:acetaldehyde dehydrogenase (acetylating) (plasmid) [Rhizobium lusitanum]|uniref:acetaldehyde dehydrogenase (acetylating) n=1 Tax=Rhizobium lusitanum TaxID=293958 RepID=UPI00161019D3|nr:acetaldehyde dehydrogenase (acetylating) [Rhizobium lusitanum]QND46577.1 acetaldehyde dehydrogenase (acetylating) [Rhizobium lusitanum]
MRVAIIGTGNIGCDLLAKVVKSRSLTCTHFIGRNAASPARDFAGGLGVRMQCGGLDALVDNLQDFDLLFDASSAVSHSENVAALDGAGKRIINLTPAPNGDWCVPAVNLPTIRDSSCINMVTCGGQASIPIAYALARSGIDMNYIEVVSTIAAKSAGPATRNNISEYIETTQAAVRTLTGANTAKAIININPAEPPIEMQTTVYAVKQELDIERVRREVDEIAQNVRAYAPGFNVVMSPRPSLERLVTIVRVTGSGDFLTSYAGNLDIITSAAVHAAEYLAAASA